MKSEGKCQLRLLQLIKVINFLGAAAAAWVRLVQLAETVNGAEWAKFMTFSVSVHTEQSSLRLFGGRTVEGKVISLASPINPDFNESFINLLLLLFIRTHARGELRQRNPNEKKNTRR